MEKGAQKQELQNKNVGRRLLGKIFLFVSRIQLAASTKQAGGVNGRRREEAAAKNSDYERSRKIRSKRRMDAENRWWVSESLAEDCEKVWIRTGWEDTLQRWYNWLEDM